MEKSYYAYPAILHYAKDGISVEFPDLPGCLPCADTEDKAFINAKEALGLHLYGMEQDGDEIPAPSSAAEIKPGEGEVIALIEVFMPAVRDRINNQFVKKTLSIPAWLNRRAEQEHVNFSRVLQDGLKSYLHIRE
ncbi:MAG: type II toxin-antitoxin system HicB family antitoxin [Oscillospiraceae bacterium]|jgi:predicted RNase H-like HicB family nuclease|nr:type II toxin-antitoxin system HicB family antitoxin [Oscillospiraceae bacterium]